MMTSSHSQAVVDDRGHLIQNGGNRRTGKNYGGFERADTAHFPVDTLQTGPLVGGRVVPGLAGQNGKRSWTKLRAITSQ